MIQVVLLQFNIFIKIIFVDTFWEHYQPLDYTFPALEKINIRNIKYLLK